MNSRKTLVTTVTVTMTTTTSPPLPEIDSSHDLEESPKNTCNAQTDFQRHFIYEPLPLYPKWPLNMRIHEEEHESSRWIARNKNEEQDQCNGQKPSRWLLEEKKYNQDNSSKWLPGSDMTSSNNDNFSCSRISSSSNNSMNFSNSISNNNNSNYYNTNYIKDCSQMLRDQFVDHHFIGPLSPPPPSSPLLMMMEEKIEGEVDLSDVSGRGLKYPPPRRDSDGHILGSANYSAPSPPERDLTLPHPPVSSETLAWKKEKTLSPLSCEKHNVAYLWKEENDSDPYYNVSYMPTDPTLSTTATNMHAWKEDTEIISGKHSLSSSGYKSKKVSESVTNERNCSHATSRPYIVKPKPFYNTSTQTEETEIDYDLQFKVEENTNIQSLVSPIQPNIRSKSEQSCLEKATQVQLTKTCSVNSGHVTLEQLRSPNHQEFIPASAPLLRKLTEEYYQMNINEGSNNELAMNIHHSRQPSIDTDDHLKDINKFDLNIKKTGTNNVSQDHKQPLMNIIKSDININKTHISKPLPLCMDMTGNKSIEKAVINVNNQMQPYSDMKKDNITINNFNEANTNIYEYEKHVNDRQSKSCIVNKKQSAHVNKPCTQFNMDINVDDATVNEQGFGIDEPKLQPFVCVKKSNLNTENSLNSSQLQPQSYRDVPMDMQNLNANISRPQTGKNIKPSLVFKENQMRLSRSGTNIMETGYMNVNEKLTDCNMQKKFDTVDDVFKEAKKFPKPVRGDPKLACQRQGVTLNPLGVSSEVMDEIQHPFWFQPNENLKPKVDSAPEKLFIQITEENLANSETRNQENIFRQKEKDNLQTAVSEDVDFKSAKVRFRSNDSLLNQARENTFSQTTKSDRRNSEGRYVTKVENISDQTRETHPLTLQKTYGSSTDILLSQTADKSQPINSRSSGKRYENLFKQTKENLFMPKTMSENLENKYGYSSEKLESQSKLSNHILSTPDLISSYSKTHFESASDILNNPYTLHHETQAVKPDPQTKTTKLTPETENSTKYPKRGLNTRCPSVEQTFGTFDDTSESFENQSFIQHGRSESLPIDSTHESPSLHLRSYYSCTDVYKGKSSERPSIYGVSDYMDMSGRHQKEWSQICSKMTDKASSNVSMNTKKKRTSSCTSYRIHANFEPEEDPPPQLPPRAYRNMPETSGNLNWMYESLRHRRSYANELRKQARRLNIYKPLAYISETHITDSNETSHDRDSIDRNIYAVEKENVKVEEIKEKPITTNENIIKDKTDQTLNSPDVIGRFSDDVKADLNIMDADKSKFTNVGELSAKCQQMDKINIANVNKNVSVINEHSSNDGDSQNINKPLPNDILSSAVNPNIDELTQSKVMPIDNNTNTSQDYKHSTTCIDDSYKSGISIKEYDIDISNVSHVTQDSVYQNEHNLNNPFEPNMFITEQESQFVSDDSKINKTNQICLNESYNMTSDINNLMKIDENSKKCVLHTNKNSENIKDQKHSLRKEIVQATSLTDLSKGRPSQSIPNQNVTPPSQSELFIPSPTLQTNNIHKMPSPESCSQKTQFHYRSSSEQCLTSIGSADQMKIPLYVSLLNIPTEEGLPSAVDKKRNLVSVKQRVHFFEYDSNGQLVGNRIPPPVPAKPTSLVLRKKVPKEEGFSPTQPSPEIDPSAGKLFNLLAEKPSEASEDITETADEKSEQKCNRTEHFQCNIKENVGTAADKISLLLPEAEEVRNNLEYFQQSATLQDEPIDKEVLIRKKNALRDSLRRKLDVLREAKLNVEAEIQEIDIMKKNICSQFENVCPNVNERRKLTDFFKDREMCQVLLSKLKVRITRLKNEMEETRPSHDLNDKLSKLEIQYSEAEQLSSDIDARQNSLVKLLGKYLTETNLSDFNYLLKMRPRLVGEMFELKEKIFSGGQKLLELERVPY